MSTNLLLDINDTYDVLQWTLLFERRRVARTASALWHKLIPVAAAFFPPIRSIEPRHIIPSILVLTFTTPTSSFNDLLASHPWHVNHTDIEDISLFPLSGTGFPDFTYTSFFVSSSLSDRVHNYIQRFHLYKWQLLSVLWEMVSLMAVVSREPVAWTK